jgi:peptidoglycan/xylan/chitin deacetylase (PgdA/CDA1 family)
MTILCYHSVDPEWSSPLAISPGDFASHCAWLARRGVVPLTDALPGGGSWWRDAVALTLDDGFAELHEHAFPVLARYRLPATVFVVAATLREPAIGVDWVDDAPPDGLRALSPAQVVEMHHAGIAFGSHSDLHRDLTRLSEDEATRDLRTSRETLEDLLQAPIRFVAYPRGRHDARVRRAAERAGFSHGFTLPERPEPVGPYSIPRVGVYPGNGTWALRAKTRPPYLRLRRSAVFPILRRLSGRGPASQPTG